MHPQPGCEPDREQVERRRIRVTGTVQGVGFRPFVFRHAVRFRLGGWVRNDSDGVLIDVEGDPASLDRLVVAVRDDPPTVGDGRVGVGRHRPAGARVRDVPYRPHRSARHGARSVGVDSATCAAVPGRGARPDRSSLQVPLHQLHELRSPVHDRPAGALRPSDHHDDVVHDVRRVPGRVRRSARSPLPRQPNVCGACGPCGTWRRPDGSPMSTGDDALVAAGSGCATARSSQ